MAPLIVQAADMGSGAERASAVRGAAARSAPGRAQCRDRRRWLRVHRLLLPRFRRR